jgi:hypothetical protein
MAYPGQRVPSPAIGVANHTPITPGPATGQSNFATSPAASAIGTTVKSPVSANGPNVGKATRNTNPYNNNVPPIGIPNIVPFPTPLGVSPQFETPNQNWTYDYGDGEGGGFGSNY